jgi:hypothetical protein
MEPLGKLIMGLLAEKVKGQLQHHLCRAPQFGFLPARAALDAIARVAKHCRTVRTLISHQRRIVMQQIQGSPTFVFCGGI